MKSNFIDPNLELIQSQVGTAILDIETGEILKATGELSDTDQNPVILLTLQTLHKIAKVKPIIVKKNLFNRIFDLFFFHMVWSGHHSLPKIRAA